MRCPSYLPTTLIQSSAILCSDASVSITNGFSSLNLGLQSSNKCSPIPQDHFQGQCYLGRDRSRNQFQFAQFLPETENGPLEASSLDKFIRFYVNTNLGFTRGPGQWYELRRILDISTADVEVLTNDCELPESMKISVSVPSTPTMVREGGSTQMLWGASRRRLLHVRRLRTEGFG